MKKKLFSLLTIVTFSTSALFGLAHEEIELLSKLLDKSKIDFRLQKAYCEKMRTVVPAGMADATEEYAISLQEASVECLNKQKLALFVTALEIKEANPDTILTPELLLEKLGCDAQTKVFNDCYEEHTTKPTVEWEKQLYDYCIKNENSCAELGDMGTKIDMIMQNLSVKPSVAEKEASHEKTDSQELDAQLAAEEIVRQIEDIQV